MRAAASWKVGETWPWLQFGMGCHKCSPQIFGFGSSSFCCSQISFHLISPDLISSDVIASHLSDTRQKPSCCSIYYAFYNCWIPNLAKHKNKTLKHTELNKLSKQDFGNKGALPEMNSAWYDDKYWTLPEVRGNHFTEDESQGYRSRAPALHFLGSFSFYEMTSPISRTCQFVHLRGSYEMHPPGSMLELWAASCNL